MNNLFNQSTTNKRKLLFSSAALLLFMAAQSVNAALITDSDRASWEAALSSVFTENFSSVSSDIDFGGSSTTVGSLTFSSNKTPADDAKIDDAGYLDIDAFDLGDYVEVGLPSLFSGFGFDYTQFDATNDLLGVSVDGTVVANLPNSLLDGFANGPEFFGIIDDTGANLDDFRFFGSNSMFARINAISWGGSSTAVVPVSAPATLALLGLGLVGLLGFGRRQKQL